MQLFRLAFTLLSVWFFLLGISNGLYFWAAVMFACAMWNGMSYLRGTREDESE